MVKNQTAKVAKTPSRSGKSRVTKPPSKKQPDELAARLGIYQLLRDKGRLSIKQFKKMSKVDKEISAAITQQHRELEDSKNTITPREWAKIYTAAHRKFMSRNKVANSKR